MANTTEVPTKDRKTLENFSGMSAEAWRMAAARRQAIGQPITAQMFRNEAYVLEHPEENWFRVKKICD